MTVGGFAFKIKIEKRWYEIAVYSPISQLPLTVSVPGIKKFYYKTCLKTWSSSNIFHS